MARAGPGSLGLARVDPDDPEQRAQTGRHTRVGFMVPDLVATHRELVARGVTFTMPPEKQPWCGFMAIFADPDQNLFYLDQIDGG